MKVSPGRMAMALVVLFYAGNAWPVAKEVTPEQEFAKTLKDYASVTPGGENAFGESISPASGELSFRHEDIVLQGIGPAITLVRTTRTQQHPAHWDWPAFGDWDLSVPRIETLLRREPGPTPPVGDVWRVGIGPTVARCTQFDSPHLAMDDWWHGYDFVTADGGRQPLLKRAPANMLAAPAMHDASGKPMAFPALTLSHWQVGCLPNTANGEAGEAFLAVAPDGTKVWLDHLTSSGADPVREDDPDAQLIHRLFARMQATRVEDRFGNWVRYHYEGKRLVSITASDGRAVSIAWNSVHPVIDAITVMPGTASQRTWRYGYEYVVLGGTTTVTGAKLRWVTRPDGSAWQFAGEVGALDGPASTRLRECATRGDDVPISKPPQVAVVTAPSGAVGTFERHPVWRARSHTPSTCVYNPRALKFFDSHPPVYGAYALAKRTISGPGLPSRTWTWTYSPAQGSTRNDACAATDTCVTEAWVDLRDPDGNRTRRTFSTRWGMTEGQHLRTEIYQGESTLLRSETLAYAAPDQGPWPTRIGLSWLGGRTNVERLERLAPVVTRTISQQGVTFTSMVQSFDAFARPVRTRRSSSLGYSRTDAVALMDDTRLWALGQVAASTNEDTGLAEARTDFDAITALPIRSHAFGKLQQARTYHGDGTVASVADSNGQVTRYDDYKRGIPQRTTHADGTTTSVSVDDLGQVAWRQDEVGHRTCYAHDAMGRITKVTYPSDTALHTCDESRWNPQVLGFAPSATAELGLPAGHWKQTVRTGNGVQVTHYDGLWRPVVTERFDEADKPGTLSQTVTRYAPSGGAAFQSYPLAGLTNYATVTSGTRTTYDALGRPTRVEQDSELGVLVTKHEYVTGFQTRTTSPKGQVTQTGFQVYDEPSTEWVRGILHPEGTATDIPRDVFGKPTSITRRTLDRSVSLTRTYAYNAAQELCRAYEPETGVTLMGYDAAGNLAWSASGLPWNTPCEEAGTSSPVLARKSTRTYDQRNRLIELEFADDIGEQVWRYTPDGLPDTVWTYNAPGRTEGVYNAWSYNSRRLPGGLGETLHEPGWTWALGYGYDRNGFVTVQFNPDNSHQTYAVNGLGQVTGISGTSGTYASGASYYPNGALRQFTYGNGLLHTLEQNLRGLPERSRDAHGGIAVHDEAYDYDAHGNVVAITDGATGRNQRGNRTMAYDGLDRLTAVSSPMFTAARYEYDALDNLKRVTIGGPSGRDQWYCHDGANRLTNLKTGGCNGASVVGLGYDAQGNLTNKNGASYVFSQDNRLRAAVGKETYRYDAAGRRVTADSPTLGKNRSFYNREGSLAFRHDGRRKMNFAHVYLAGSLVVTREQSTATGVAALKYHHTDALGTPVATTDASRNVVERSEYEPYGKLLNRPANDGPGYTGHVEDSQTGLTYMQQRYFDPLCGCFLSVDPVTAYTNGDMRIFNRYVYGFNNPYTFTDPDGRHPVLFAIGAGLAWLFNSGDANAPTRGEQTRSQTAAEGVGEVAGGIPAGRLGTLAKMASEKTYHTYTKQPKDPSTHGVYTGRTSGTGTPADNVAKRDAGHHRNGTHQPAQVDKSSSNPAAIRGREQQVIEANGGAQSTGGTSGNAINGIAAQNPKRDEYIDAAKREFGG